MKNRKPDFTKHNPAPEYLQGLIDRADLTRRRGGWQLGVSARTLRAWLAPAEVASMREAPYSAQFLLEVLADQA
jgi:hypothetical protein